MKDAELSLDLETTVPTDMTVSSFSDHAVRKESKVSESKTVDRYYKDRKEIIRQNQMLKIELSRKISKIQSLENEFLVKVQEYEDKLKESTLKNQILHTQLKTGISVTHNAHNRKLALIQKELEDSKLRANQSEEILQNIKHAVAYFSYSDKNYSELKAKHINSLDAIDYVKLKTYEIIWGYKKVNEELKIQCSELQETNFHLQAQLHKNQEVQQIIQTENEELKKNNADLSAKLMQAESQIVYGNFAVENFARVKNERDMFHEDFAEMKKNMEHLEAEFLQVNEDKDKALKEVASVKFESDDLQRKCNALNHQQSDLLQKLGVIQDENSKMKSELKFEKSSREELFNRFILLRDRLKTEHNENLLQQRKKVEVSLTEHYESKLKSLHEKSNSLLQQKESAESAVVELKKKYEELYLKFQEKTLSESAQIEQLRQELENAKIQSHKTLVNYNTLQETMKEKCLEYEKLVVKLQLTEHSLETLTKNTEDRIKDLEVELGKNKAKLEMFEKVEIQLNEVMTETAKDENITDHKLDMIAEQLCLQNKMKDTFVKGVHLTRKTLQLERQLHSQEQKLADENKKNEELKKEVSNLNHLLEHMNQPYSFFFFKLRDKERNVAILKHQLTLAETEIKNLYKEKENALEKLNALSEDFDKVLKNQQEIVAIKKSLKTLESHCQSSTSVNQSNMQTANRPKQRKFSQSEMRLHPKKEF